MKPCPQSCALAGQVYARLSTYTEENRVIVQGLLPQPLEFSISSSEEAEIDIAGLRHSLYDG
jgi:hypothetical protein